MSIDLQAETERLLRATLREHADRLPTAGDPWEEYDAGRKAPVSAAAAHASSGRARRPRHRSLLMAAAVAAVVALVMAGAVRLPGWAPGIDIAGRSDSPLATMAPVGSLAGDDAWLAGLLAEFVRQQQADEDQLEGLERGPGFDLDNPRVVYAGDVSGRRLAAIVTDGAHHWLEGSQGAAPSGMRRRSSTDGVPAALTWLHQDGSAPPVLVVVTSPGNIAEVSEGAVFGADGMVRRTWRALPMTAGGLVEETLPAAVIGGVRLRIRHPSGTVEDLNMAYGGTRTQSIELTGAQFARATAGTRGDTPVSRRFLDSIMQDLDSAGVPVTTSDVQVRWSGTVQGVPAILLTVQPPGGGLLTYAHRIFRDTGQESTRSDDLATLLPAAGAGSRPIAWRLDEGGSLSDSTATDVVVVAPAGAARVEIATSTGTTEVPLDEHGAGMASVPLGADATVRVYGADGALVGETPILQPAEATRLMDLTSEVGDGR